GSQFHFWSPNCSFNCWKYLATWLRYWAGTLESACPAAFPCALAAPSPSPEFCGVWALLVATPCDLRSPRPWLERVGVMGIEPYMPTLRGPGDRTEYPPPAPKPNPVPGEPPDLLPFMPSIAIICSSELPRFGQPADGLNAI